jgi:hypothetical protein
MDYSLLTDEDKAVLYENTIRDIEGQHFSNTLALKRAEASGREEEAKSFARRIEELEKELTALS